MLVCDLVTRTVINNQQSNSRQKYLIVGLHIVFLYLWIICKKIKFDLKFPPSFIFDYLGRIFFNVNTIYSTAVSYSTTDNIPKNIEKIYNQFHTNDDCIPMIDHCIKYGYCPINNQKHGIDGIYNDNTKRIIIGFDMKNYIYLRGYEKSQ